MKIAREGAGRNDSIHGDEDRGYGPTVEDMDRIADNLAAKSVRHYSPQDPDKGCEAEEARLRAIREEEEARVRAEREKLEKERLAKEARDREAQAKAEAKAKAKRDKEEAEERARLLKKQERMDTVQMLESFVARFGHLKSFFPVKRLAKLVHDLSNNPPPFKGYAYEFSDTFMGTKVKSVNDVDQAQLKIYEEPSEMGQYVMGVDPAFGRSANGIWLCGTGDPAIPSSGDETMTTPCPNCPDGNVWGQDGPTGQVCPVCHGYGSLCICPRCGEDVGDGDVDSCEDPECPEAK